MGIHSKILVHWTGKEDFEHLPEAEKARKYLDRLKDYYENGLFLKRNTEAVIRKKKIKNLVRLCFTEIRLSQTKTHAARYGKLGIGFIRDFVLNRGGRPVIYIPFKADVCFLEDCLRTAYDKSADHEDVHRALKWIMAYVKRMSEKEGGDEYYEEMEWRIVYDETPDNKFFAKGHERNTYRLGFKPSDVKVIVFPNEKIKQMALKDKTMAHFLSQHMPTIVTLDDCDNF